MVTYGLTRRDLKMARTGLLVGYKHDKVMAVLKNLYDSRKRRTS